MTYAQLSECTDPEVYVSTPLGQLTDPLACFMGPLYGRR